MNFTSFTNYGWNYNTLKHAYTFLVRRGDLLDRQDWTESILIRDGLPVARTSTVHFR